MIRLVGIVDGLPGVSIEADEIGMRAVYKVYQVTVRHLSATIIRIKNRIGPTRADAGKPIHGTGPGGIVVQIPFIGQLKADELAEVSGFIAQRGHIGFI